MKVGNLDIGNKLFLAPMAEVTDSSFRKMCKEEGAGLTFTQMVSAEGVIRNNFETLRHFSFNRSEKPIGVQILGNDPAILKEAASEISKVNADLIDLNCGCPVDKVCSKKMGASLLEDTKRLGTLVRAMVDGAKGTPISVKLRLGRDKSHISIFDTAQTVQDNGGSLVFIHGRTRAERYDTIADWTWLKKVKEVLTIPVVGNGSLFTPQNIKDMIEFTGCDSAMIARGALGNPFIFSRYNTLLETGIDPGQPDLLYTRDALLKQIKHLEDDFGELLALDKAKKQTVWYFKYYTGVESFLKQVFSMKNLNDLRSLINEHVEKTPHNSADSAEAKDVNSKFQKKVLFWLAEVNIDALG